MKEEGRTDGRKEGRKEGRREGRTRKTTMVRRAGRPYWGSLGLSCAVFGGIFGWLGGL